MKSYIIIFTFLSTFNLFAEKDTTSFNWQKVPGTNMEVKIPDFFKPGEGFNGFIHKESATSIVFHQIDGYSYKLYHAGYISKSKDQESAGVKLTSIDTIQYKGLKGFLYEFSFTPQGATVEFSRKLFITGDMHTTLLVMINYPQPLEEEMNYYFLKIVSTLK